MDRLGVGRRDVKRYVAAVMGVLLAIVAAVVFTMPSVMGLSPGQFKLVIFHGGDTWANLVMFTFAGLAGLAYLATSRRSISYWETGFRNVAMPLWLFNAALGVISASITWTGFSAGELLAEPKLMGTFYILAGSALIIGIDSLVADRRITALLDAGMAGVLWYLILSASNYMHPDNPMRSSDTDPAIKVRFYVMALALVTFWTLASYLVRLRAERTEKEAAAELPAAGEERAGSTS